MNVWLKSLLPGIAIATIVYFFYDKFSKKEKVSAYDIHYTIKVTTEPEANLTSSIPKVMQVLKKRLETAGYRHAIRSPDTQSLRVSLFNLTDTLTPRGLLSSTGWLQFREVYTSRDVPELLQAASDLVSNLDSTELKKRVPVRKPDSMSKDVSDLLDSIEKKGSEKYATSKLIEFTPAYDDPISGAPVHYAEIGNVKIKDTAAARKLLESDKIKDLRPSDLQVCFGNPDVYGNKKNKNEYVRLYFIKTFGEPHKAVLENEDVSNAWADFSMEGKVEIRMQFNRHGTNKWAVMTGRNIGRPIAMILDGIVLSAPNVESAIPDGTSVISGTFTINEAQVISHALKSQRLPGRLTILSADMQALEPVSESNKKLLVTLVCFLVSCGLSFFIVKTLKPT